MKIASILLIAATIACAENQFPVTPAGGGKATALSSSKPKLGFLILDYGLPNVYGGNTCFWINEKGKVITQRISRGKKSGSYEERYEYTISSEEIAQLVGLLGDLRKDDRTLKERYGNAGEFAPLIAFSIRPWSDLFIREKHDNDSWNSFAAVSSYLSGLHRKKIEGLEPAFVGEWKERKLWEPEGFVSRSILNKLSYLRSEQYGAILDEQDKGK